MEHKADFLNHIVKYGNSIGLNFSRDSQRDSLYDTQCILADGRYLLFESWDNNNVSGDMGTNRIGYIFIYDLPKASNSGA
jgi:hypothetical protein